MKTHAFVPIAALVAGIALAGCHKTEDVTEITVERGHAPETSSAQPDPDSPAAHVTPASPTSTDDATNANAKTPPEAPNASEPVSPSSTSTERRKTAAMRAVEDPSKAL